MKKETLVLKKDQAKVFNLLMSPEVVNENFYAEHGHSDLFLSDFKKLAVKKLGWEQAYAKEVILSMPTLFDVWDTCEFGVRGDNRYIVNPWSNECLYIIGGQRLRDYVDGYHQGDMKAFGDTLINIIDEEGNIILGNEVNEAHDEKSNLSSELKKLIADNEAKINALKAEIEGLTSVIKSAQHLLGIQ